MGLRDIKVPKMKFKKMKMDVMDSKGIFLKHSRKISRRRLYTRKTRPQNTVQNNNIQRIQRRRIWPWNGINKCPKPKK